MSYPDHSRPGTGALVVASIFPAIVILIELVTGICAGAFFDPVPTIVRKWACDIARKFLWKDRAGPDSPVSLNHDAAMAQLRDVARGTAALPDAAGTAPASSGGSVSVSSSAQTFTDDVLALL